tara:strand:+ start:2761 stop:3957 length:1197 start_codon:yes stop_codon:yes gene_type:complete
MVADDLIQAIQKVLELENYQKKIFLHEPFFKDTLAKYYVQDCIESGWVSSAGEYVKKFEESISKFTGAKYVVAVNNGTAALRLGLYLLNVKPNDEVITSPLSFVATANAISHLGAIPNFVDIEKTSLGISPESLDLYLNEIAEVKKEGVINKKSGRFIRAILPIHIFGNPAKILEIKIIADKWGIPIIEDAAEALGSGILINNKKIHCGLFGELGIISFNGNKIITTGGGGAIITNNKAIASRAKHLSTTAKKAHPWEFFHDEIGWNDRLPNINAALGLSQMEVLEERLNKKKSLHLKYIEVFSEFDQIEIVKARNNDFSNNWLITLRLLNDDQKLIKMQRDEILKKAHNSNIFIRPAWELLNKLPMYENNPTQKTNIAFDQINRLINLPSSPQLFGK